MLLVCLISKQIMNRIVLITGASSGIGWASAIALAQGGDRRFILTARRLQRLEALKQILESEYQAQVLCIELDVRDRTQVESKLGQLPEDWQSVDLLINNAGLASGLASIEGGDIEDWERMIDTNLKGLLYVTRTIAPQMKQRKSGHIINISSIAGRQVYPNGNVYCATKHAVQALGQGMRMDLVPYGIKVTQICPGAVETEFSLVRFHGDQERADKVYEGFTPLSAEDVADAIRYVANLPQHVSIDDLLIMPTAQASASIIHRQ